MRRFLVVGLLLVVMGLIGWWVWGLGSMAVADESYNLTAYLSGENEGGFAQATEPADMQFPRDLGAHPDYQTEWWYYTGNLKGKDGRDFGFQFTIFRRAIAPTSAPVDGVLEASPWRSNQIYFAHFTVSDVEAEAFYDFEKFSRGAVGLAGAEASPYAVWIGDWAVREQADGTVRMFATEGDITLDLSLVQGRPAVLQGVDGYSQKGSDPENASYYYSIVNQATAGTLTIGDEVHEVSGHTWKDHEYSTSALEAGATGWDWFSLQFENADENALMLFQIRRDDGTIQAQSGGSWVLPDGSVVKIARNDVQIEVLDTWTSPESGAEYPIAWRIRIPKVGLDVTGEALMLNQELNVSTVYWEGAVKFTGTLNGESVQAYGYVEMTGYAGSMAGRI